MRRLIPPGTRLALGRPGLLAALIAVIGLVATQAGAAAQAGTGTGQAGAAPRSSFTAWTTPGQFGSGAGNGISVLPGDRRGIVISQPAGTTSYRDPYLHDTRSWDYSTWTSPVHPLDFGATELVASWDAQVPPGTWLKTELQATMADGEQTPWLDMGNYAYLDTDIARTSVSPVAEPFGEVDTDTFFSYAGWSVRAYQLRITLYRPPGTDASPRVWQVGAFASFMPPRTAVPASLPGPASQQGTDLPVPPYSQDIHAGQAFDQGEITGAGYRTAGHLWVVTGFTRDGNVIVNDPANPSDAQVRHVFNRRQFENVWLRTYWVRPDGSTGYGSGGVAYLIKPHDKPLPPNLDPANPAW